MEYIQVTHSLTHRVEITFYVGQGSRPFRQSKYVKKGNLAILAITAIASIMAFTVSMAIAAITTVTDIMANTANTNIRANCSQ